MLNDVEIRALITLSRSQAEKQNLVIFTDMGRDHDDEVALTAAAGLLKLGFLDIKAIISCLQPAEKRAQLTKGVLDILGFPKTIPVGVGSNINEHYSTQSYEFNASYISQEQVFPNSQDLLKRIFEESLDHRLHVLIISGMTDAARFIKNNPELAQRKISKVTIMGGLEIQSANPNLMMHDKNGHLIPDNSYNNKVDMPAAQNLYELLQVLEIPMLVVSRFAAMACAISPEFYNKLAATNSAIGERLCKAQSSSINHLWQRVFREPADPHREGLPPYCNKDWFLKTFTANTEDLRNLNATNNMWPYVTKLNAYDPVALLAAILPELFNPLKETIHGVEHSVIGLNQENAGVRDADKVRLILVALSQFGLLNLSLDNLLSMDRHKKSVKLGNSNLTQLSLFSHASSDLSELVKHEEEQENYSTWSAYIKNGCTIL